MIQSDSSGRVKTIKPIKPRKSLKKKRNRREFDVFEDSGSSAPQTPIKRQRNASALVTDLSLNNDADSPETKQMKKELLRTQLVKEKAELERIQAEKEVILKGILDSGHQYHTASESFPALFNRVNDLTVHTGQTDKDGLEMV